MLSCVVEISNVHAMVDAAKAYGYDCKRKYFRRGHTHNSGGILQVDRMTWDNR